MTFENSEIASFSSANFKIFKNALSQSIPYCPPKEMITSTNFNFSTVTSVSYD